MKTYAKFLSDYAAILLSVLVFCTASAKATTSIDSTASCKIVSVLECTSMPPSSLEIVSLTPFVYNGDVNVRCNGTNTGRVTVDVTGGVPPYSYSWSSGFPIQGGIMAVGLFAGQVSVTVTDAAGNSVTESVTLTENPPLQAIANVDPILCHGGVATITLDATGGTMPYSGLNWFQFATGTYDFTVADANGCRAEVTTEISEPPALVATSVVSAPILCHGDTTSVIVEATGGVAPYNGVGVYDEYAGNSSYTITDANGCYAYTSVSIDQPTPLTAIVNSSEVACRGDIADITVEAIGGVTPYSGIGNFTAFSGNLNYTVTDANGCQASSSIQVTQPPALVATISNTPIACNGDLSAVQVTASGGTAPYIGPGTFYEPAGTHVYTVEDANGCSVDITTFITQPGNIELEVSWGPLINNLTNVAVSADGGTPAYVGTGVFPEGPGVHTFTVYDANGCSSSEVITISGTNPALPSSDVVILEQNKDLNAGTVSTSNVQGAFNTESNQLEIIYQLNYNSEVSIELYDMSGALVETILIDSDSQDAGVNVISIDTEGFMSGVYLYNFVTNTERQAGELRIVQ